MVQQFSYKKDGDIKLSKNFKVKEFVCKNYEDKILIDIDLVEKLQKIRDYFNKPIIITSAYRSPVYNKSIGSGENSYHTKGQAFDIQCKGVSVLAIQRYAYEIGIKGIGTYYYGNTNSFIHIDSRDTEYLWLQLAKSGTYTKITDIRPMLSKGCQGVQVKLIQQLLGITADGIFGSGTSKAVIQYQKINNLAQSGIIDTNTWLTFENKR